MRVSQLMEHPDSMLNVWEIPNAFPQLPLASYSLAEIDSWLAGARAELAQVEEKMPFSLPKIGWVGCLRR